MLNSQNKQVTTKFQNGRNSVPPKPIASRSTTTVATQTKAGKQTTAVNSQRCPAQGTAKELEPKPPAQPAANAELQKTKTLPNKLGSAAVGRRGAATVNKRSRPFVPTTSIFRPSTSKIFDYDLSREEKLHFLGWHNPMKSVPVHELQLLQNGQRVTYLETRYDRSPDLRYNYPEATSFRYGWFHRKGV
ncbi:hypothetical protein KR093_003069 [Drosophila rubida]|uniref:Sperm microtubule inner protein 1 C-terminal domain-containing protein n=1 Tax=Drosophila rubida TaxID=30044 RepID=A0AAD4PNV1_9MUSC|nr:hypothetical protein KR093_003069 [Drosophila rubida]